MAHVSASFQRYPLALRLPAQVISYVFHPLFIPVYMGWFFIYVIRLFPERNEWQHTQLLIQFFVNYTLLPLVTLLLAKGLGFVKSIYLDNPKDRIIPYVATGVFYFWVWYVFKNQQLPRTAIMFSLAIFLASSAGLILNSFFKISMHALAMGVVVMLMLLVALNDSNNYGIYVSMAVLLAGLVCTSRLIVSSHRPKDVYAGLLVGGAAQLIAYLFS